MAITSFKFALIPKSFLILSVTILKSSISSLILLSSILFSLWVIALASIYSCYFCIAYIVSFKFLIVFFNSSCACICYCWLVSADRTESCMSCIFLLKPVVNSSWILSLSINFFWKFSVSYLRASCTSSTFTSYFNLDEVAIASLSLI